MVSTLFTSRNGGISLPPFASNNLATHVGDDPEAVARNRERLSEVFGPVVFMNQSHGDRVVVVDSLSQLEPNADALITQEPGIALAVLVADCIPLLLWDEITPCVAAVHVGRRGLQNGIALGTIEIMRAMGSQHIQGLLGPSICGKCYEVGSDVYEEVAAQHPSARSLTDSGTLALDLPAGLAEILASSGIHVTMSEICTADSPSHYSYRRDGVTGRTAGVISL